jgi:drug/metabolite transporter (DMT)-like permease
MNWICSISHFLTHQALVGQIIFDESVSLMWWLGTLLIIFGLLLMNYGGQSSDANRKGRRKKYKAR